MDIPPLLEGAVFLMIIFMFINFLINPAFALLPLLTVKHFGGGAMEYAFLESLAGLGMVLGGLFLGLWGGTTRKVVTCMAATGLCGIGVFTIGIVPPSGYMVAALGCLVIGLTLPIINGTVVAIMQKGIRADMQGRALALLGSGVAAMSPVGLILAGPIADAAGIQPWFIVGGTAMFLTAIGSVFMRSLCIWRTGWWRRYSWSRWTSERVRRQVHVMRAMISITWIMVPNIMSVPGLRPLFTIGTWNRTLSSASLSA
jgi:DHA3 family macrolide efflux protein-like MFS transporter